MSSAISWQPIKSLLPFFSFPFFFFPMVLKVMVWGKLKGWDLQEQLQPAGANGNKSLLQFCAGLGDCSDVPAVPAEPSLNCSALTLGLCLLTSSKTTKITCSNAWKCVGPKTSCIYIDFEWLLPDNVAFPVLKTLPWIKSFFGTF